jgi:aspartyl-tRNA(Asn)/glutamyl-tRNA(Gln) amidotransferase subunit C
MKIDKKTIQWIAELARLRLDPLEEKQMEKQLGKILDYMDILEELDLEDVPPTSHTLGFTNVTREDTQQEGFDSSVLAGLAPRWHDDHVIVPKIV